MRVAVLSSPGSWYFRDLARAAAAAGHEVLPAAFTAVASSVTSRAVQVTAGELDLAACDVVLVRTMPPGSLEQVVFRMDALARLEAAGTPVINPARAIEAAVDKYLASARLASAGLPHPRTVACQGWEQAMAAFETLGRDVVVKPLFGSEGRGIARLTDEAVALRVFKALAQLSAVVYVQEFIEHAGYDLRVLVIGRRALGIRRRHPTDWRTNVSRGAVAEPLELSDRLVELAQRASDAVGTRIAGVDLLPGRSGELYVLEVNAVPGWKGLSQATGVDAARLVLEECSEATR